MEREFGHSPQPAESLAADKWKNDFSRALKAFQRRFLWFFSKKSGLINKIAYRLFILLVVPLVHFVNRVKYKKYADPDKIITIPINMIHRWDKGKWRFKKWSIPGDVVDGNWDLNVSYRNVLFPRKACNSLERKFLSLKAHFIDNVPWIETELFRELYAQRIKLKGEVKGCRSLAALAAHYSDIYDELYESIKRNGVVPPGGNTNIEPIYVYIGRNGDFIYTSSGNHRLCIAALLGINKIPVKVWWRHNLWQKIRDDFASLSLERRKQRYTNLVDHPDLKDI